MTASADVEHPPFASALDLLAQAQHIVDAAIGAAQQLTNHGERIDEAQVLVERVAYAATELRAAHAMATCAAANTTLQRLAGVAIGECVHRALGRLQCVAMELGVTCRLTVDGERCLGLWQQPALVASVGQGVVAGAVACGARAWPIDEMHDDVRAAVHAFAQREVAPHAEHIHRTDELVPERIIAAMAREGYFGLSVPEAYGGHELGNLAMILTTEELSRASLAAGGSLITRPEILAKALLAGGTETQKRQWLPRLASGEMMAAIAVTEPNTGSDVAAMQLRATPDTVDGVAGWRLNGAKAWCTFAGRADVLAVLARTDTDASKGAKGLSLFVVEKPRALGHAFAFEGQAGGRLEGKADRTPGYRGMHSFSLAFDNWFVPHTHVVGEAAGLGRGFVLQMAGFAAGRLQTGGRAVGVGQAALDATTSYVIARQQFGQAIAGYQLTQFYLGQMAAQLAAARALTYEAARAMDTDERAAAPLAAQAKLFACDVAVALTQQGQILHGGWGYAEEYAISRYAIDASVLPIFEGVKPILALKVVGRALLAANR